MEIISVKDVMIPLERYPYIYEDQSLKEAMIEMRKCRIDMDGVSSLPRVVLVFNRDKELVGLVRRRDIMRGLEPKFLVSKPLTIRKSLFDIKLDPNLSEISYDSLIRGILERATRPVSDVMLPVEGMIDYNDHLIKAMYEMVDVNVSLLPVLKDNEVVGVIRSVDALRHLGNLIFSPEELREIEDSRMNCE